MENRKVPIEKNQILEVSFVDVTHDGAGVAKVSGFPLFVPNALPGEKAEVKVVAIKKGYGFGKIISILEESLDRVDPPCLIYEQCGGCQLQHMSYEAQLKVKRKQVQDSLSRIGHLTDVNVLPVLGMSNPWRYRNKAQVPVGEMEGGLVAGFYQKRSHQIINMDSCLIQHETNDEIIQGVKDIAQTYGIRAYDEKTHKGTLRHIMTRYGHDTKEVMVVIITKNDQLPNKKNIINDIIRRFPQVKSIVQNVNPKRTNVIFGNKTDVLWGEEYLYDSIGPIKFAISARSFYQVNPEQTKVLYEKTLQYANLQGTENVIDAYCGIGTISLFLAQKAGHVYGVEIVPEAIEDANRNAKINEVDNVTFEVGEAESVIPKWYEAGITADVIVVDPPRKGCDEKLLKTIIDMKPNRVVYVSCNPATLARDLKILEMGGFKTEEVQPVDMFPHTTHVECVILMTLKDGGN